MAQATDQSKRPGSRLHPMVDLQAKSSSRRVYFHRMCPQISHQLNNSWPTTTPDPIPFENFLFRGFYGYPNANTLVVGIHLCSATESLPRPIKCVVSLVDMSDKKRPDLVVGENTSASIVDWAKGASTVIKRYDIKDYRDSSKGYLYKYEISWK